MISSYFIFSLVYGVYSHFPFNIGSVAPAATAAVIDYKNETISFDATYEMNTVEEFTGTAITSGASITDYISNYGTEPQSLYIRVKATMDTPASAATAVTIPARPRKSDSVGNYWANFNYLTLTVNPHAGVEYTIDEWVTTHTGSYTYEGLEPNTDYTICYRDAATNTSFRSLSGKETFHTRVKIQAPTVEGESKGSASADKMNSKTGGTVTYTVTFTDGYTPTLTLSGNHNPLSDPVKGENNTWTYTYTVHENDKTVGSVVTFADTRSDAKEITAFTIPNQVGVTAINQDQHTVTVTMPTGTDVTALTPDITVSAEASISPVSGAAQDFTNPVTYTVTAENETTQNYTVTVTVQAPSATAPVITTQALPDGTVETAYNQTLAASGTTPITWNVSGGSLPDGLNLNTITGVISGIPTVAGTFTFTVKAENSAGDNTKELFIRIATPAPTVTSVTVTPAVPSVQKGTTQQFLVTVRGTNNPAQTVTWSIDSSHADSTTITRDGLLTVASDETQTTLTIKAVSTVDINKNGTATVTVTEAPPAPIYGISLSRSGTYTFAEATVGYGEQTTLAVTVTNTGNQSTGILNVQVTGAGKDAFTLSNTTTINSIAPGDTASFTVQPVIGLSAGTYTSAVQVSGSSITTAEFDVSFTVSPARQTAYTISGTVKGSDTGSGIPAVLQLKNSENTNVGAPVTAGADGSYTFTGIPAGAYHIEVSLAGYDSGTIGGIIVSDGDVTGRNLTLTKTVSFIPVTGITMTSAATVKVNTNLTLAGTVSPDNATNRNIIWTVADAGGTGAVISGSTFRAAAAGTATVKAAVAGGLTVDTPYEKTFTITVKEIPAVTPTVTHTVTATAGSGGTISPSGTVTVNEGESQTFAITPDSGYKILRVTVDGTDQGDVTAYTFEQVTADHSISVTFERVGSGSSSGGGSSSSDDSSSSSGSSSTAPATTTSTTAGENGTSTTTTRTTSRESSGKTTTVTTEVTKDAAGNATGSATTVSTDNITTSADQGNATVTVKPDAAAIDSAAKAAGASETNPMDISVVIPRDTINSELLKADVNTVRAEVVLPKSAGDNPAVRAAVTVEKETVDAARQTGKNVTVIVREDTGTVKAVWSLDGQAMGNAAGQSTDLNLGVRTAPVQSNDPIATPVKPTVTAAGQENGLVISFTADGNLLSGAKLTVPATNQTAITAGSTVVLHRFDQKYRSIKRGSGGVYSVDANGNVTMDIPAGTRAGARETYVLLPVAADGTSAAGMEGGIAHTIQAGDTLNQISRQYGCRVEDLLALNPGVDIYALRIGSELAVPAR